MITADTQSNIPFPQGKPLPEGSAPINILDVDYLHVKTADGGDLYLTKYGHLCSECDSIQVYG